MLGGVRLRIGGVVICTLVACTPAAFAEQERDRERPFRPMFAEDENLPRRLLTFDLAMNEALGQAADGLVDG